MATPYVTQPKYQWEIKEDFPNVSDEQAFNAMLTLYSYFKYPNNRLKECMEDGTCNHRFNCTQLEDDLFRPFNMLMLPFEECDNCHMIWFLDPYDAFAVLNEGTIYSGGNNKELNYSCLDCHDRLVKRKLSPYHLERKELRSKNSIDPLEVAQAEPIDICCVCHESLNVCEIVFTDAHNDDTNIKETNISLSCCGNKLCRQCHYKLEENKIQDTEETESNKLTCPFCRTKHPLEKWEEMAMSDEEDN
jgi:hypothetical protein